MKETKEDKIAKALNRIYCNNCKFNNGSSEFWKETLGYYGCDECNRKMMGWEPSSECIQDLIKIVKEEGVQR